MSPTTFPHITRTHPDTVALTALPFTPAASDVAGWVVCVKTLDATAAEAADDIVFDDPATARTRLEFIRAANRALGENTAFFLGELRHATTTTPATEASERWYVVVEQRTAEWGSARVATEPASFRTTRAAADADRTGIRTALRYMRSRLWVGEIRPATPA
ncbi:hypothetical protein AB0C34_17310 [Nocardia sp. NPDC049220]|uniref:hypothetical protein n=1 Tax=Nocardia sp. NPDC049220 TaxID=3155273 RepID=UPI0033C26FEB